MKKILRPIIILVSLLACSLDHSNPLDNDKAPAKVIGIEVEAMQNPPKVIISWQELADLNTQEGGGYYIYRSLSYDGAYERIATIDDPTITTYEDEDVILTGEYFYYYKLSAFKNIDGERLEGQRSDPVSYW
jgi:fibronectin type 3 domain-containing protein